MSELLGRQREIISIKEQCDKFGIDFKEVETDFKNGLFSGEVLGGDILAWKDVAEKYFKERFGITI